MLQVEMAQTGDRSIKTFIKIAQQELQGIKEAEVKATFMDTKIAIENRFKFQVNLHQTSIREFYAYIPHLKAA
jgi:CRISPR/Cas system CSM-associated protein Csm2 small subunit